MDTSDSTLLDRWTNSRDAQAFAELVSRHAGMVHATCRRILRDASAAEDATQDCFLQLCQGKSPKERPLGAWLHRVATNRSLDLLRNHKRRIQRERAYIETGQTVEPLSWDDVQQYVDQAIEALPADLRTAIVHHFLEGKTQEETAALVGISRPGITRRIQRGVEYIRRDLNKRGVQVSLSILGTLLSTHLSVAAPLSATLTAALGKLALAGAARNVATTGTISTLISGLGAKSIGVGIGLLVTLFAVAYLVPKMPEPSERVVASRQSETQNPIETEIAERRPETSGVLARRLAPVVEDTTVESEPDYAIHGRIVNAVTGEPVRLGVEISGEVTGGRKAREQADENGEFRFDGRSLGYGAFTLSVKNYNYYPFVSVDGVRLQGVSTPEIVLSVTELPTISGRVLYADGSPVEGAGIMRTMLGGNLDDLTYTDEDGRFAVHHDGGRWVLRAMHNLLRSEHTELNLDRETSVNQDFILPPKGGFTISITTSDGKEVHDIHTSILMTKSITSPFLWAVPAGKNRFTVDHLPFDTYSVELRTKGYMPELVENVRVSELHSNATITAHLTRARLYSLTMRVLDTSGHPVPNAGVVLERLTERLDAEGNVQARIDGLEVARDGNNTNLNGERTAKNIHAGTYRAYCNDVRGIGDVIVEVPESSYVTLHLQKGADSVPYEVKFIDAFTPEKPLSPLGAYTFFVRENGTPSGSTSDWGVLLPGWNSIIAIKEGKTAFLDNVYVGPHSPSDKVLILAALGEAGLISGVIEKPDGTPAAGDYLYVFPENLWSLAQDTWSADWKNLGRGLAQGARVGADGHFAMDYLPEGSYVVALSDTAYSEPIDVKPGYETGPVVITRDTK